MSDANEVEEMPIVSTSAPAVAEPISAAHGKYRWYKLIEYNKVNRQRLYECTLCRRKVKTSSSWVIHQIPVYITLFRFAIQSAVTYVAQSCYALGTLHCSVTICDDHRHIKTKLTKELQFRRVQRRSNPSVVAARNHRRKSSVHVRQLPVDICSLRAARTQLRRQVARVVPTSTFRRNSRRFHRCRLCYQACTLLFAQTFAQHWTKLKSVIVFLYRAQLMAGRRRTVVIDYCRSQVSDFSFSSKFYWNATQRNSSPRISN